MVKKNKEERKRENTCPEQLHEQNRNPASNNIPGKKLKTS